MLRCTASCLVLAVMALLPAVALCDRHQNDVGEGGLPKGGELCVHAHTANRTSEISTSAPREGLE